MDTYAYDAHLPCKNPNCKSHGTPHPNCKCYSSGENPEGYADGGDVAFCAKGKPHQKGCSYFAEGGDTLVPADDMPSAAPVAATGMVPQDDLPAATQASGLVPKEDLPSDHSSLSGLAATAIEGFARNYIPGSDALMKGARNLAEEYSSDPDFWAPKMSDVAERQEQNPGLSRGMEAAGIVGGFLTGTGEAGLIKNIAGRFTPEAATVLGRVGSNVLKGAIENTLLQGGDELSKAMLGKSDPEAPVSNALINMGAAGLFGGLVGGGSSAASESLKALGNAKAGKSAASLLAGMGWASKAEPGMQAIPTADLFRNEYPSLDPKMFDAGRKFFDKGLPKLIQKASSVGASAAAGTLVGAHAGIVGGIAAYQVAHQLLDNTIQKVIGKPITAGAQKYGVPVVLKMLSAGKTTGLWDILDHAAEVNGGAQKATKLVDSLFKAGSQQSVDTMATDREREKLNKYIENGGIDEQMQQQQNQDNQQPQGFAEGGDVNALPTAPMTPVLQGTDALAEHLPEQNMLMQAAKGRVSNYLNSVRPLPNAMKLPFDEEMPDKAKERSYNKALDIALKPLSVLNHVKEGTLTPEHMQHFVAMYPEVHNQLKKQITERILKAQMNDEKPSYKVRQGLSMFMGTALSGEMTPGNIAAAQKAYAPQQASQQASAPAQGKNKRGTSTLTKVADQYRTADQASEARQRGGA